MVWDDVEVQWYYPWFGCFSVCLSVLLLWHSAWLKACLAVAPSLFMVCTRFDIGLIVLIKIGLALVCTWFNCKVWHWFGLCLDSVLSQQARCGPPVPCCSPRPGQLRGEEWCKGHCMRQKIHHQNAFDQTRDRTQDLQHIVKCSANCTNCAWKIVIILQYILTCKVCGRFAYMASQVYMRFGKQTKKVWSQFDVGLH